MVTYLSFCHIPNSETCLRHVWLQYNIKSPWLFSICVQNSTCSLVLYNRLIPPKVHGYFALFESKSMAIFICIHCLIISFKLCKFTQTLCRVFPSPNLNSYIVLWDALDMNNFYFLFLLFSDFIRILFSFSFGRWRGTWHRSHMTDHMMWCHKA